MFVLHQTVKAYHTQLRNLNKQHYFVEGDA